MFSVSEFHWQAYNRFGQKQKGKQLAQTREQVEKRLIQQGFQRIRIQRNFVLPQKPKPSDITQFVHQLALLLRATLPLKQSLTILLNACQNGQFYRWLTQIILQIDHGFSLSHAIESQQRFFTQQEIQLIKMGEKSGTLTLSLENIAQTRLQNEQLHKKIKKILFYPLFILGISLSLTLLMLWFIVPQFADLYDSNNQNLPFITAVLFQLSAFLQQHFSVLVWACLAFLIAVALFKKHLKLTALKYRMLAHLPIFHSLLHHSRLVFFCQNAGLMLNAHLRLDSVLSSFVSPHSDDPILAKEITHTLTRLKQGYTLAESLPLHLFSDEVIQMIAVGEKSANLATMLLQISEISRQKLDYQIDLLSQLLEPLLMLFIGAIVGTVLVGLYLPIFEMGAMME